MGKWAKQLILLFAKHGYQRKLHTRQQAAISELTGKPNAPPRGERVAAIEAPPGSGAALSD